jgi:hypothetical protein
MPGKSGSYFVMDDRGLGGTYLIQQQFLDMYRKIHYAKKTIDNETPNTGMFRRPYYSKFGDYYNRIPQPTIEAEAKVDTSAPESYRLLAGLYINQPRKPASASPRNRDRKLSATGSSLSGRGGKGKSSLERSIHSIQSSISPSDPTESGTRSGQTSPRVACKKDKLTSLEEYLKWCTDRKAAINNELVDLRKRRLVRIRGATPTGDDVLPVAAMSALRMMDMEESSKALAAEQQQELPPTSGPAANRVPRPPLSPSSIPSRDRMDSVDEGRKERAGRKVEFGPPLEQLLYPKKNIYEKGPGSVYQAGAPTAGRPTKPLEPAAPPTKLVYHKHSCAVVAPYDDDEEDGGEPDDDFTVAPQHQGDTSDEEE